MWLSKFWLKNTSRYNNNIQKQIETVNAQKTNSSTHTNTRRYYTCIYGAGKGAPEREGDLLAFHFDILQAENDLPRNEKSKEALCSFRVVWLH